MKCKKCHRRLSDPESISRGYGPVCFGADVAKKKKERNKPFANAAESDFDYRIDKNVVPVLVITDLNLGRKSVTNNIEAVLHKIASDIGSNIEAISGMPIIYRDSDGYYDGVRINYNGTVSFYPIAPMQHISNETDAIHLIRRGWN